MFVILDLSVTDTINRCILFSEHDFNFRKTYIIITFKKSYIFDYNNTDLRLLIIERLRR